jgi:hypothetical protein
MASGFWKITTKWNQAPYGWSETWYMTASAIAQAKAWLASYIFGRTQLMNVGAASPYVQFVSATISDVNNKNTSQLYGANDPDLVTSTWHGTTFVSDPSDAAVRLYCTSASNKHRVFMCSALPQPVQSGNTFVNVPEWTAGIARFKQSLVGTVGSSTTIGQIKILDQSQIKYPIVACNINTVDSRFMVCTTALPVRKLIASVLTDVVPGDLVLIRRVQPSIEVNRIWLVASNTPNYPVAGQYTLVLGPHKTLGQINQNVLGIATGYVRPVVYVGDNITSVTQELGVWNRRRGKLYGLPVGRRKVR